MSNRSWLLALFRAREAEVPGACAWDISDGFDVAGKRASCSADCCWSWWWFSEGLASKAERPWRLAASLSTCNVTKGPQCFNASAALECLSHVFFILLVACFLTVPEWYRSNWFYQHKESDRPLEGVRHLPLPHREQSLWCKCLEIVAIPPRRKITPWIDLEAPASSLTFAATMLSPRLLPFLFKMTVSTLLLPSLFWFCPFSI